MKLIYQYRIQCFLRIYVERFQAIYDSITLDSIFVRSNPANLIKLEISIVFDI